MKKPVKLWTADFFLICLVSLGNYMAFQGLNVSLPVYIEELGGNVGMAGLSMAALTAAAVIIRPFTGSALDKFGRKWILVGGLVLILLPSLAYIILVPLSALLMLRFVQGFGWGISNTAAGTTASDIVPPDRLGEGMGTFNVMASISGALAPFICLWLINEFSYQAMFGTMALLSAISVISAQAVKYPQLQKVQVQNKLELFSKKALRPVSVVFLTTIAHSSVVSFVALFARERGIVNPGLFFVLMGVTTFFSRPLSGKFLDRLGRRGFDVAVGAAAPMMAVSFWVLSYTTAPWYLAASGIIYGIGAGTIQSSMLTMAIQSLPEKRGLALAMYGTFLDTGIAAGSVLWGIVAYTFGYPAMFRLTTIPVLMAMLVYFMGRKQFSFAEEGIEKGKGLANNS